MKGKRVGESKGGEGCPRPPIGSLDPPLAVAELFVLLSLESTLLSSWMLNGPLTHGCVICYHSIRPKNKTVMFLAVKDKTKIANKYFTG